MDDGAVRGAARLSVLLDKLSALPLTGGRRERRQDCFHTKEVNQMLLVLSLLKGVLATWLSGSTRSPRGTAFATRGR